MSLEIIFFVSLFGVSYSYFVYPLILTLILKSRHNEETKLASKSSSSSSSTNSAALPCISFIITAYNEEKQIAGKLDNTLCVDYPSDKLEIIVASDGSTDQTNSIVESYQHQNVLLHPVQQRKGKENAQKSAIGVATGEIIVFSDVSTKIEPAALHQIATRFVDPNIGAVSSEDRFISENGKVAGEGAYVKYEMWLRQLESKVSSLVGLSGSFFAARKVVCYDWNIRVPSDFNTALNCVRNGFSAITAPELLGFYPNLKDESKEYQRKIRTVIRGMAALLEQRFILNPFKYGLFAFQVFSHKMMRWLVPWFQLLTLITNVLLWEVSILYKLMLVGQLVFYGVAFLAGLSSKIREFGAAKIPYFFVQVNLAIAHASIQFIGGKRVTLWKPSKR